MSEIKKFRLPYQDDEIISALHKCLRAGDFPRSCFFAKIIKENIGVWRVKQYIFYIIFEETMNIDLFQEGLCLFKKEDTEITDFDIYKFICKFCNCTKKWELESGVDLYLSSIKSSMSFMKDIIEDNKHFSKITDYDRLKYWQNVIKEYDVSYNKKSKTHKKTFCYGIPELFYYLEQSVNNNNFEDIMYLSELFYMNREFVPFSLLGQFVREDNKKIFEVLNVLDGKYGYFFNWQYLFFSMLKKFNQGDFGVYEYGYIKKIEEKINIAIKERRFIEIPAMAHDGHTSKNKHIFARYKLEFNKPMDERLDMRFSGKWLGIFWRISSFKQYGKVVDKWEDVFVPDEFIELNEAIQKAYIDFYDEDIQKKIQKTKYEDVK